ncbi:competence type IV pilus minor pilin ComGG [Alteribacter populi]|uniref:competence type IV pilus minor pilin ComGG n=1 Tax=Alteribacter populi TaxID=2011011 RepID=UPI000BBA6F31|nr:competence type IV pilus minor pilin ComGG [Alteribacter populi]
MNNEHGFVLLMTVLIMFLLSGLILHQSKLLVTEREFTNNYREWVIMDTLLQRGREEVATLILQDHDGTLLISENVTENGTIQYDIVPLENDQAHVTLKVKTSGGNDRMGTFTIDLKTGVVSDWREGKVVS